MFLEFGVGAEFLVMGLVWVTVVVEVGRDPRSIYMAVWVLDKLLGMYCHRSDSAMLWCRIASMVGE